MAGKLRHSTRYFLFCALCLALLAISGLHATKAAKRSTAADAGNSALVKRLKLTDLCLFTEARYTRHPSMADKHAAFQEHPAALDHFPSGSFLQPRPGRGERR